MLKFQSIIVISNNPQKDLESHFDIDLDSPHVDINVYRPELTIGIDAIKDIINTSKYRPLKRDMRNIVILEAEKMTTEAQNALLKLLEEPPDYVCIMIVCEYPQTLLETVLSRCQIIRFPTKTEGESNTIFDTLSALPPSQRLSHLPTTKTREAAIAYCKDLIQAAELSLFKKPNSNSLINLKIINCCYDALKRNANPTIALTDSVLRLRGSS